MQRRSELRVGVDIHLGQDPLAVRLGGELLQHRAQLLARLAPVGPQIDDHRRGPGPLDHVGVKGLLGDLEDGPVTRLGRSGRLGLLPALRGRLPRTQIDGAIERKIPRLHYSILPHTPSALTRTPGLIEHRRAGTRILCMLAPGRMAAAQQWLIRT